MVPKLVGALGRDKVAKEPSNWRRTKRSQIMGGGGSVFTMPREKKRWFWPKLMKAKKRYGSLERRKPIRWEVWTAGGGQKWGRMVRVGDYRGKGIENKGIVVRGEGSNRFENDFRVLILEYIVFRDISKKKNSFLTHESQFCLKVDLVITKLRLLNN